MTAETASPSPHRATATQHALLGLYAQTSLHPGSGTALGLVDMPVQRERHTLWPTIPGSAIKGVARDACREHFAMADKTDRKTTDRQNALLRAAFGPDTETAGDFAGAVSFTDARLLAFPVRSLAGVFAYVSCPGVLRRLHRDLEMAGEEVHWPVPKVDGTRILTPAANGPCLIGGNTVVLEEFLFTRAETSCKEPADWIADNVLPNTPAHQSTRTHFGASFLVLSDDQFTHFARYATEITARVRLDYDTKTVAEGALFYEESLPPETLFYSIVLANGTRSMASQSLDASRVLQVVEDTLPPVIQLGANQTTGKGFCFTRLNRTGR
jgi:CRISPR-associated protein Cmr4